MLTEDLGHGLGIVQNLLSINLESWIQHFFESHSFGCNDMLQWSALNAWEDS